MALDSYEEEGNRPACAACRHQRKKCREDCVLWRHFPVTEMENFQAVHRVFGISNLSKMIKSLDRVQQDQAVKSFLWEARMWREDPVRGPLGLFNQIEQEVRFLRNQINILQPRPLITAAPPARPETYPSLGGGGVGNFNFHSNYTGQPRMNHGYQIPIQSNFSRPTASFNHLNNVQTQNARTVAPPRPPQQHLPPPYNNGFGHNKENALVNPYANVGVSGQDRRSLIRVGDRTSNVVRPSGLPAGPGMPSKRSTVTVKHGNDQIVGRQIDEDETADNEARDIIAAALYYDNQLLDNTNQNNAQD